MCARACLSVRSCVRARVCMCVRARACARARVRVCVCARLRVRLRVYACRRAVCASSLACERAFLQLLEFRISNTPRVYRPVDVRHARGPASARAARAPVCSIFNTRPCALFCRQRVRVLYFQHAPYFQHALFSTLRVGSSESRRRRRGRGDAGPLFFRGLDRPARDSDDSDEMTRTS